MIRWLLICFVVALSLLAATARAGEQQEIELKDGSIISGEVVSLSNGIYTFKSDTLGILKIDDSKVKVIRPKSPSQGPGAAQNSSASDISSLQHKMMSDQEIMDLIQSLQNNPEFKTLREDPEIMKAVNAGDIAALTANQKFMKLLDNPMVQDVNKKVR